MAEENWGIEITATDRGSFRNKKVTQKLASFSGDTPISDTVDREEMLGYLKYALITIAKDALQEELSRGFNPNYETYVDGAKNDNLEAVSPVGKIQFVDPSRASEIVTDVYLRILKLSPQTSGTYFENNFIMYNDRMLTNVDTDLEALKKYFDEAEIKKGDIIRFVNIAPYAGFLEKQGVTSKQRAKPMRLSLSKNKKDRRAGIKVRQPNGVYYLAQKSLQRKYGTQYNMEFQWVNGRRLGGAPFPKASKSGKPLRTTFAPGGKYKGAYVYPSIVIKVV